MRGGRYEADSSIVFSVLLGVITIVSVMASGGRSNREMELADNLPAAVEETVSELMEEKTMISPVKMR